MFIQDSFRMPVNQLRTGFTPSWVFKQWGYYKILKGPFTAWLSTHDQFRRQELCPVAWWLTVHCRQPDLLDRAFTKEREHINSGVLLQGDWCHIDAFLANQDVKLAGELSSTINILRVTGRSRKPSDLTNTMVPSKRQIIVWVYDADHCSPQDSC